MNLALTAWAAALHLSSALEVEVSVEAAWPAAPLEAEFLDGLAVVGRGRAFLRLLAESNSTDQASWHNVAVEAAEASLGSKSFRQFLSLRTRLAASSAVVEAARGLERADRDATEGCKAGLPWAVIRLPGEAKTAVCGEASLKDLPDRVRSSQGKISAATENSDEQGAPRHTVLDHVLYSEAADGFSVLEVIGYADLGDASSQFLLRALFSIADFFSAENRPGIVAFRHGQSAAGENAKRAVMAGYGVELAARSADEVAKNKDTDGNSSALSEAESSCRLGLPDAAQDRSDPAEQYHGIDLRLLADLNPGAASALCDLRSDLVASVERPLLPWEQKRLGAKAVLRATRIADANGAAAGLEALGEVARDYPSGWGLALSAGGPAEEAEARKIMEKAEAVEDDYLLEVNGWKVPEAQRGVLPILRSQLPLFRGVELLTQAGIDETVAVDLFLNSEPGPPAPTRIDTGDPRLTKNDRSVVIFDLYRTSAGPLGNRPMFGVGVAINPCLRSHVKFVNELLEMNSPAVVWVRFRGSDLIHDTFAKFLTASLNVLAKIDSELAASLLKRFAKTKDPDQELCQADPEQRLHNYMKIMASKKNFEVPSIADLTAKASSISQVDLPVPSITLNGQLLAIPLEVSAVMSAIKQETQITFNVLQMIQIHPGHLSDEQLASWQYGRRAMSWEDFNRRPSTLKAFWPGITSGSTTRVNIAPSKLKGMLGQVFSNAAPSEKLLPVVHTLIFGGSDDADSSTLISTIRAFLDAYVHLQRVSWRAVHVAAAGGCHSLDSPLSVAAAVRRCLATVPMEGVADVLSNSSSVPMEGVADVLSNSSSVTAAAIVDRCSKMVAGFETSLQVTQLDVDLCDSQQVVLQALPSLPDSGSALIVINGRVFGPVPAVQGGVAFSSASLAQAEDLETHYGPQFQLNGRNPEGSATAVNFLQSAGIADPYDIAFALGVRADVIEDCVAARTGDVESQEQQAGQRSERKGQRLYDSADSDLRLHLAPKHPGASLLRVFAVIDPLGKAAQRLPPLLLMLWEELNADVRIVLRPKEIVSAPLTGFYRAAVVAKSPGGLLGLRNWSQDEFGLRFELPPRQSLLLSTELVAPDDWLCPPVEETGGADLDSLQAGQRGEPVKVRYVLEALFIEGVAMEMVNGMRTGPAAGRQLALKPLAGAQTTAGSDSVVVKSGYFQLRQSPGLYQLSLSSNEKNEQLLRPSGMVLLTDLAGRGSLLQARIGSLHQADSNAVSQETVLPSKSAQSYDGSGGDTSRCQDTIHIFSVASGLRYERLLRIMMMSVREHTPCPLRFWLVENFLSPSFRKLLPGLAKEVGFEVSRITYKWPSWLREQTQKQRVIWAYKILFLDVLFPADVKRVLFIDADQIVRADVKELWDTNLGGKVYGFVPFCGSGPPESLSSSIWKSITGKGSDPSALRNPETVGFRFWEQGFWQNHLSQTGTYYHISALFVVDLEAFRRSAAGDILRDVYQQLTADPHSLANLDQDLPNYIQRTLPIYSLPQEWLWCESWCSNETKATAKTIDMCQNPVHKEGKLQQARRIAPEWVKYDEKLLAMITEMGF